MPDLDNTAQIIEASEGLCALNVNIFSRIANDKRRALLAELALKQVTELEQVVAAMEYEEVEQTYDRLKPIAGTNGDGHVEGVEVKL